MAYSLTPRQMQLLRFIAGYQEAHGGIVSPSIREMSKATAMGHGTLSEELAELEFADLIHRLWRRARAIEILAPIAIPSGQQLE